MKEVIIIMTEKELRNLQVYIGKRNKGQTDNQVIDHINKINDKVPLTQEEWHKIIFPCCNNGYVEILKFVLENIESFDNVLEYMKHTVYGRNELLNKQRIEVLKIFISYLSEDKVRCLSETMFSAAWFGETEIVKFLLKNGADKAYKNANGLGIEDCAERAEKLFEDDSLRSLLAE